MVRVQYLVENLKMALKNCVILGCFERKVRCVLKVRKVRTNQLCLIWYKHRITAHRGNNRSFLFIIV